MKILSIETSCDETAAAIVENGRSVLSSVIYSQVDDHKVFGGVVPEIASRKHIEVISDIVNSAIIKANISLINNIDCIAVTSFPGLIGSLLVGLNFAKSLAYSLNKPLISVNHIYGHIAANYIDNFDLEPPFLCLVISGGHTQVIEVLDYINFKVIATTRDDAIGEVFDKVARVLGLGYPGGSKIEQSALNGDELAYKLPYPKIDGYDFSFSGLKTAVINLEHKVNMSNLDNMYVNNIAASFQKVAIDILIDKFFIIAQNYSYKNLAIAGGVAANKLLRYKLQQISKAKGYNIHIPDLKWCGDNAAMIGVQGYYEYINHHNIAKLNLNAIASKKR